MSRLKDFISVLSGFRKFSVIMLVILVGILFRVLDYISGAEFVDLLKNTTIAFMSFNGIEHMTGAIKEWVQGKMKK